MDQVMYSSPFAFATFMMTNTSNNETTDIPEQAQCDFWNAALISNLLMAGCGMLFYFAFQAHRLRSPKRGVVAISYPYPIIGFLAALLFWQGAPNSAFFIFFYQAAGTTTADDSPTVVNATRDGLSSAAPHSSSSPAWTVPDGKDIACHGCSQPIVSFYIILTLFLIIFLLKLRADSKILADAYVEASQSVKKIVSTASKPDGNNNEDEAVQSSNDKGDGKPKTVNILFVGALNRGVLFGDALRSIAQMYEERREKEAKIVANGSSNVAPKIVLHVLGTLAFSNTEPHIKNNARTLIEEVIGVGNSNRTRKNATDASGDAEEKDNFPFLLEATLWGIDQSTFEPVFRGFVFDDEEDRSSVHSSPPPLSPPNIVFDELWISPRLRDILASFFESSATRSQRFKTAMSYVIARHTAIGAKVVYFDNCMGALNVAEDLRETGHFHSVEGDATDAAAVQPDGSVCGGVKAQTTVSMSVVDGVTTSAASCTHRTQICRVDAVVMRKEQPAFLLQNGGLGSNDAPSSSSTPPAASSSNKAAPPATSETATLLINAKASDYGSETEQFIDGGDVCTPGDSKAVSELQDTVYPSAAVVKIAAPVIVPPPAALWKHLLVGALQCAVYVGLCCLLPPSWEALAFPKMFSTAAADSTGTMVNNWWLSGSIRCFPMSALFSHTGIFNRIGDAPLKTILIAWLIGDSIAIVLASVFTVITGIPSFLLAVFYSYVLIPPAVRTVLGIFLSIAMIVGLMTLQSKRSQAKLFASRGFDLKYKQIASHR